MKKETTFTAKQVGGRIKERRTELNITMPELGRRVGVNKSTIQRYEADGVDPKRTMVINFLHSVSKVAGHNRIQVNHLA